MANTREVMANRVTYKSLPVCAASAMRKALSSSRPRFRSYQTMTTFASAVTASTATSASDGRRGATRCTTWLTASRNSSKHEIERNPTMASVPSDSNLS